MTHSGDEAPHRSDRSLWLYFSLAYAISWVIWAPLWLPALGVSGLPVLPYHHALGAAGPMLAAIAVTWRETGWDAVRTLLRRLLEWRDCFGLLAVALIAPFAITAIAVVVARLSGDSAVSLAAIGHSREFPEFSTVGFLFYNFFTFGIGEEVGWRGFALPRLQSNMSAFRATLLLTLGWALWHAPLFLYRPGYTAMGPAGILGWLVSLLTGAILLTWLYNSSGGSLLVVAVFHATIDVAFTSDFASPLVTNISGAFITVWGVLVLLIAGPRRLSKSAAAWDGDHRSSRVGTP